MSNRLCRIQLVNNNPKSRFSSFEVLTMREYIDRLTGGTYFDEVSTAAQYLDNVDAYDDIFYRVFGVYRDSSPRSMRAIGDFNSIEDAKNFLFDLTGDHPDATVYY